MNENTVSDNFSKNVHKSTIWNIVLKGIGIACSLVLLRLNLFFLGASLYGLWVTITSISSWGYVGDLGIGNGLRNELTKAIAAEDYNRQKSLIKTALVMLSKVSLCLFVILSIVSEALFITNVLDSSLRVPLYITNAFFCLNFILGLSSTVAYSYQKSWMASLASTASSVFCILVVLLLIALSVTPGLTIFAIFIGIASTLGNCVIIVRLYKYLKSIMPAGTMAIYQKDYSHAIINIGIQFFVLQLSGLILYSTDNVIINKIFDSASVSKYSVINSVYNAGTMIFSLILISLWSAVTYVAEKKNYIWIKKEINNLLLMWGIFIIGVIVVSFLFNWIVKIWLGEEAFVYESSLIVVFALFTILNAFGAIYVNVANGLGVIKLQMICAIIGALVNIPLSILLADTCGMGLTGIRLATIICCFGSMFLVPIQIHNFIKRRID